MADIAMARHPRHDRLLIAAAVDRGSDVRPSLVRILLATCLECARLHADLLSLALALPAAATPARPRDFTLTEADARRLRARGLRRWLGLIGTTRDTITRPLAIGFTTLGLVGLVVTTVPGALPGAGSGAGAPQRELQSAASPSGPVVVNLSPQDTTGAADTSVGSAADAGADSADPRMPPAFVVLSASFVLTGGALLMVRWARPRGHWR